MTQPRAPSRTPVSAGARFRAALEAERPLQIVGAINAYHARLAERTGYRAIYLSGGGVAAGSLGLPDLAISTLDDVLTDVRRITDVCGLPLRRLVASTPQGLRAETPPHERYSIRRETRYVAGDQARPAAGLSGLRPGTVDERLSHTGRGLRKV